MIFDPTYYGYGIGFVMLGWCSGMVVSVVLGLLRKGANAI